MVVAYAGALGAFRARQDPGAVFLGLMERGFAGVEIALAGTPYI